MPQKEPSAHWFKLQLRMGYVAAVFLPVLAVFCVAVLLKHEAFPGPVVA